jgi:hypothetical protein
MNNEDKGYLKSTGGHKEGAIKKKATPKTPRKQKPK